MTDPVTVAREVLEADRARQEFSASNPFGAWDILDELRRTVEDNAPHLAHTVLRLAALADDLDEDAVYVRNAFNGIEGRRRAEERRSAAARIRTALNGETHD